MITGGQLPQSGDPSRQVVLSLEFGHVGRQQRKVGLVPKVPHKVGKLSGRNWYEFHFLTNSHPLSIEALSDNLPESVVLNQQLLENVHIFFASLQTPALHQVKDLLSYIVTHVIAKNCIFLQPSTSTLSLQLTQKLVFLKSKVVQLTPEHQSEWLIPITPEPIKCHSFQS